MAAIADSDDLHAWLIRGFVEAGLPDHTRGGREWSPSGAMNLENYIQDQGAGGILLQFLGQVGEMPSPEDEYTYHVAVVRAATGTQVVVTCPETLFSHAFPDSPREELAAHILAQLRVHNEAFDKWRTAGGDTTYAERLAIPAARGSGADRALLDALESLRRSNRSVTEGPANNWWVGGKAAGPVGIVAGLGQEPQYRTKKALVTLTAEDLAHAARLRTVGTILMVLGGASLVVLGVGAVATGYTAWSIGYRGLLANGLAAAGISGWALVGDALFAASYLFAGARLRELRSRSLVRAVAIFGIVPCCTPCCAVGLPLGGWVLYLLHDARSSKVFAD